MLNGFERGGGIKGHAHFHAGFANGMEDAVEVGAGFLVDGEHIGTGLAEGLDVAFGFFDHEVYIEHFPGQGSDGFEHRDAERDIGYEHSVHHIKVNPVGPAFVQELDFFAESGEISGEERGCDDNLHKYKISNPRGVFPIFGDALSGGAYFRGGGTGAGF